MSFMEMGVIKLTIILLLSTLTLKLVAQENPFQDRINIKSNDEALTDILKKITTEYGYAFSYNSELIKNDYRKSIYAKNTSLQIVLTRLLSDFNLIFKFENGVIIINKAPAPNKVYSVIKGTVLDETSGKPLAGVNIFISGTTMGTTTDRNGFYRLSTNIAGNFELVFSYVTHFPVIKKITLTPAYQTISVSMKEIVAQLDEILIQDSNKEWERYMKIFEKEFIGTTPNASRCKITNPWVIDFDYDPENDILSASAKDLIVVKNEALGYNESHLLLLFEYSKGRSKYVTKSKYELMDSKNRMVERRWENRRMKAYEGSFEHFLNALMEKDLKQQGFEISLINTLDDGAIREPVRMNAILKSEDSLQYLVLPNLLEIIYKDVESSSYRHYAVKKINLPPISAYQLYTEPTHLQKSVLESNTDLGYAIIQSGTLKDPLSIKQHGYWSWKRTADSLPLDFINERRQND